MPLQFSLVCLLLETLHEQCLAGKHRQTRETVQRWFQHHRQLIRALDSSHGAALLSTLLPARRTDRVYCIQAPRLERIFARAQRLGASRLGELYRYKVPGSGVDLADCIHTILKITPNPVQPVTVLEIDDLLHAVASAVAFSSPAVRAAGAMLSASHRNSLESMYVRLSPLEAKWFTRLVLKDYRPIELDDLVVLQGYHPVLPPIMKVLDHFPQALAVLDRASQQGGAPGYCDRGAILRHLRPVLGTKVGRPLWRKGRSIKHCLDMSDGRMSVEKKLDGEYCQIHIDLSKTRCIQIFSKSGKDSTHDRSRLHSAIRESLDIGQASCKIKKGCILEGELLVYNDSERKVLPFHKIRNHVTRSGRYMNTDMDSPPRSGEHLMIIYYDVLLIDDESLLGARHSARFERLQRLIVTRTGYAELVDRQTIDTGRPQAASDLRNIFAKVILAREEGLVLKPDDPFINLDLTRDSCGSPIKFKKEYIGTFGDVGDFAVVGARYDPDKAKCYRIPGVKWTHFYLGCVARKSDLYTPGATPEFTVVAVVDLNETMLETVVTYAQPRPVMPRDNHAFKLFIPPGLAQSKHPTVVFSQPLVFDLRCFSFDKEGNVGFYTPRFPNVSKVHFDRDYRDAITFPELQKMAKRATRERPWEDRDSQEFLEWIGKLEGADPGGRAVDRVTQETASTIPTPSPEAVRKPGRLSPVPESTDSSGESSQESHFERAITLTPPTSLPAPPSSQAAGSQTNTPATKRKSSVQNWERNCPNSQTSVSEDQSSPRVVRNIRLESPPWKRYKSDANDQKENYSAFHVLSGSPSKCHGAKARRPTQHDTGPEPLAEVVNGSQRSTVNAPRSTRGGTETFPQLHSISSQLSHKPAPAVLTTPCTMTSVVTCNTTDAPSLPSEQNLCPFRGAKCPFYNRPILLAPYLTAREHITRNLLPQHGIRSYITDHAAWRPEDVDRPDTWKICLVDTKRTGETLRFLEQLEGRPLKRREGREYMEVYDWRVLDWVLGNEKGASQRDAFRRWFVGLV